MTPTCFPTRLRVCGLMFLAMLFVALSRPAFAQPLPADRHEDVSLTFDRSSPPTVWRFRPVLRVHYTPDDVRGSQTYYLCRSTTDSSLGACPTRRTFSQNPRPTPVSLRFVEARSGLGVDLNVNAEKNSFRVGGTCSPLFLAFNSFRSGSCRGNALDASQYELTIPRVELQKIPVGGIWRGRFEFDVVENDQSQRSAVHSYNIELRVTDRNNAQIYFPTLDSVSPRVALDLRMRPGPGGTLPIVSGGKSVDLCFYDGFGSNSPGALRVRVSQPQGPLPGQPAGHGAITLLGVSGALAAHRIDYRVGFAYDGSHRWLTVGDAAGSAFTPVAQTGIRMVRLPGIPLPVACSPGVVNFEVVPFHFTDKRAGAYRGQVRLEMFADAAAF